MKRNIIGGGLALVVLAAAAPTDLALAASLTRSSCWTATFEDGKSTACFFASGRITMTNYYTNVRGSNPTRWATCDSVGRYVQSGDHIAITIPANSGKCSNGAQSPNFTASCEITGDSIPCDSGYSIVSGNRYEFRGEFE